LIGLRYENFGQPANSAFDFPAFAGFDPAQFLVPNKVNPDNNNFEPSVGFAWTPSFKSGPFGFLFGEGKTVWRGGYQVSYDTFFNNLLSNIAADTPNSIEDVGIPAGALQFLQPPAVHRRSGQECGRDARANGGDRPTISVPQSRL
jgi:hypothetical protein